MNFLNSFFENTEDDQAMNVDAEDNAQTIREKRLKLLESKTTTKDNASDNAISESTVPTKVDGASKDLNLKKRDPQANSLSTSSAAKKSKTPTKEVKPTTKKKKDNSKKIFLPNAIIKRVFQVTLNESDNNGFYYLKDLADSTTEFSLDMIDSILYSRLSEENVTMNPLPYLVHCYSRILVEEKKLNGSKDEKALAFIKSLKTFVSNFFNTTVKNPEIFPSLQKGNNNKQPSELFGLLFHSAKLSEATTWLLSAVLKGDDGDDDDADDLFRLDDDEERVNILQPLFQQIGASFNGKKSGQQQQSQQQQQNPFAFLMGNNNSNNNMPTPVILEPFAHAVNMLKQMLRLPHAARVLIKLQAFSSFDIFNPNATGQQVEQSTLIGNILRIGTCGGVQRMGAYGGNIESAVANQYFSNPGRRSLSEIQHASLTLRRQVETVVKCGHDLIKSMLVVKGTGAAITKKNIQKWICRALVLSNGRMKDRPNPMVEIHDSFALNFNHVLLRLSEPFTKMKKVQNNNDGTMTWPKMKLINLKYLSSNEIGTLFGDDGKYQGIGGKTITCDGKKSNSDDEEASNFNFVTRCFFFTVKAQHVGLIVGVRKAGLFERHMSHVRNQGNQGMFESMLSLKFSRDVQLCDPNLMLKSLDFITFMAGWIYRCMIGMDANDAMTTFDQFPASATPNQLCSNIPISLVENIADVLAFIAQTDNAMLSSAIDKLDILLSFVTVVLKTGATYFPSPHLRAKFGDLMLYAFVPPKSRGVFEHSNVMINNQVFNAVGTSNLLCTNTLALQSLAPSLLALYGDVENTGFYDKTTHRLKISYVLKYLWTFDVHKTSIRKAAMMMDVDDATNVSSSSAFSGFSFITFANGILNQINSLISDSMGKLQSIKQVQDEMKDQEAWFRKSEEERKHIKEKLDEDEQHVKSALMMSNETLDMLTYLTVEIKSPFLSSELLGRLASTLNSVLVKLAGRGGLQLKVDDPEKYHFKPKIMLKQIASVYLNMSTEAAFLNEVSKEFSQDFYDVAIFSKTNKLLTRMNLLTTADINKWAAMSATLCALIDEMRNEDAFMDDAPDEFLDPILCDIMTDPVRLPSGHVMDRNSIKQHLLNDELNPFTREKLTVDDLVPATDVKEKIDNWIKEQRAKTAAGMNRDTSA